MFIKGVGMTDIGVECRDTQDMVQEAVLEALDDADMKINKIEAIIKTVVIIRIFFLIFLGNFF